MRTLSCPFYSRLALDPGDDAPGRARLKLVPRDPSSVYLLGLDDYRAGRYFEAHERWEELWLAETDLARKRLLQALIQIAAAMHKLHRQGHREAALRLLSRAQAKLPEGEGAAGQLRVRVERAAGLLRAEIERAAGLRGGGEPVAGEAGEPGGEPAGELVGWSAARVPVIGEDLESFAPAES